MVHVTLMEESWQALKGVMTRLAGVITRSWRSHTTCLWRCHDTFLKESWHAREGVMTHAFERVVTLSWRSHVMWTLTQWNAGKCRMRHWQRQGSITRLFWCFCCGILFRKQSHHFVTMCSVCCSILPSSAFCVAMSSQQICNKWCVMRACIIQILAYQCHVLICELWRFYSSSISSLLVPLPIS